MNYNCVIFDELFIVKTTKLIFCSTYKNYYLGEQNAKYTNSNEEIHWDISTQSMNVYKNKLDDFSTKYNKLSKLFTWKMGLFYYSKMRFTGKGYKIKKTKIKKSFKFYFGKSHITYAFGGGLVFKKLSKYRLFFISNNKKKINKVRNLILSIKPINKFTKRGLRVTKHFILKRPGKKTNY